jgi:hypothetical protein
MTLAKPKAEPWKVGDTAYWQGEPVVIEDIQGRVAGIRRIQAPGFVASPLLRTLTRTPPKPPRSRKPKRWTGKWAKKAAFCVHQAGQGWIRPPSWRLQCALTIIHAHSRKPSTRAEARRLLDVLEERG